MFKVVKFDKNDDGDAVCKELFKKGVNSIKKKSKVLKGRISKAVKEKASNFNEEKIRDEVKRILQNGVDSIPISIKPRKKKKKQDKQHLLSNEEHAENNSLLSENKKRKKHKRKKSIESVKELEEKQAEESPVKKKRKKKRKKALIEPEEEKVEDCPKNKKKKRKQKKSGEMSTFTESQEINDTITEVEIPLSKKQKKKHKFHEKLKEILSASAPVSKPPKKELTLREKMMQRIQAAQFRILNEQIYSTDSKEAQKLFQDDPDSFAAYHEGYRLQVTKWPLNPLDIIIKQIQALPKNHIVADFGCGEAKLGKSVNQKVHSFDLVACNDRVKACDMAHVPLDSASVDIAVFCLSLMGTNLHDYLLEANRVLKVGGILMIAEVESRFDDVNQFIEALSRFHFKNTWKDFSHNLFYFLNFKKESNIKKKSNLPTVSLHPCLYKKR